MHCQGAKKKGIEITNFLWSTTLVPAFPLSYDLIKDRVTKSMGFADLQRPNG
jgi:hypothetical protein